LKTFIFINKNKCFRLNKKELIPIRYNDVIIGYELNNNLIIE